MYHLELSIIDLKTECVCRKEIVPFYSLWAARNYVRKAQECKDVMDADVIDQETGEIMLHLSKDGSYWDSEG